MSGSVNHLRSDAGFTIVEVATSAVLLIVVALGIFATLDTASGISGSNKARAVASGLAQEDLERMRSLKGLAVSNLREPPRIQRVADVDYTIVSRTDWVTDSSGSASCASNNTEASYLKTSSTVTWPAMRGLDPVKMDTLIAPPNGSFGPGQGTLAVSLTDRSGNGVANIPVTVSGPRSFTDSTNADGCILYGNIPVGSYTVSFAAPGFVDEDGQSLSSYSRSVEVQGQATTTKAVRIDRAGTAKIDFKTGPAGSSTPTSPGVFTIENAGLASGRKLITFSGSTHTATLFPFTDGYKVYAGDCTGNDPADYGTQPSSTLVVPPAGTASAIAYEPKLGVVVGYNYYGSTGTLQGANVFLTKKTAGCSGRIAAGATGSNGRPPDEFFPYGTYDVCAEYFVNPADIGASGPPAWYRTIVTGRSNTGATASGGADTTVTFTQSAIAGRCT